MAGCVECFGGCCGLVARDHASTDARERVRAGGARDEVGFTTQVFPSSSYDNTTLPSLSVFPWLELLPSLFGA